MPEFDPRRILQVLQDHGVRYVVIGGFAAAIHGSPYVTSDIDVVPATSAGNLARLSSALDALAAQVRSPDGPLPFSHSASSLAQLRVINLTTEAGDLDLTFVPSGTSGFDDLIRNAEDVEILGLEVPVASLADVIRSKEAAGREKDLLQLPLLRQLLDES